MRFICELYAFYYKVQIESDAKQTTDIRRFSTTITRDRKTNEKSTWQRQKSTGNQSLYRTSII